mmetsp:Transcript_33769/g.43345  ORF Transcript_33769/g.43345 Transcript_33769/m.43345 type:complete len:1809 (+) Transcript_33769:177-5603(+)
MASAKKLFSTTRARPRSTFAQETTALPGWNPELLEIENETTNLLDKIHGRPKTKGNALPDVEAAKTRRRQKQKKKRRKAGSKTKKKSLASSGSGAAPLMASASQPMLGGTLSYPPTRMGGRMTVEVLEDYSDDDYGEDEQEDEEMSRSFSMPNATLGMSTVSDFRGTAAELKHRDLDFAAEEERIRQATDTFVPGPNVTLQQLEDERQRLDDIQLALDKKAVKHRQFADERRLRKRWQEDDRAALLLQKVYRGHLGRRRAGLFAEIANLRQTATTEWKEVRDEETGDVWYYNVATGQSQWDKPASLMGRMADKEAVKRLPAISRVQTAVGDGGFSDSLSRPASATSQDSLPPISRPGTGGRPSTSKVALQEDEEYLATRALGFSYQTVGGGSEEYLREDPAGMGAIDKLEADRLFLADGSVGNALRDTVQDVLKVRKFDSVSTLIAHQGAAMSVPPTRQKYSDKLEVDDGHKSLFHDPKQPKPMVALFKKSKKGKTRHSKSKAQLSKTAVDSLGSKSLRLKDLAVRDVSHPGFSTDSVSHDDDYLGTPRKPGKAADATKRPLSAPLDPTRPREVCFNCWSAGQGKNCMLHKERAANTRASESALMCKNWDLGILRRRYRSEEIQEVFMKSASSLRWDRERKCFVTVVEQRHPVYRSLAAMLAHYNFLFRAHLHTANWFRSFIELFRMGKIREGGEESQKQAKILRLRGTLRNLGAVNGYRKTVLHMFPRAPITGTTIQELAGTLKVIEEQADPATGKMRKYCIAPPVPVPVQLYKPRQYLLPAPKSIPMPEPGRHADFSMIPVSNEYISNDDPAAWFERISAQYAIDTVNMATFQIMSRAPLSGLDKIVRTKYPPPLTVKFATFARKATKNNMAVGGLSAELTVSELVTTYVPPQYGNFTTTEKSVLAPDISVEITLVFESLLMEPVTQIYVHRPLQHPLNSRRAPCIMLSTQIDWNDKFFYGKNRPAQTGEEFPYGFRTSVDAKALEVSKVIDPKTFVPGADVTQPNWPAAHGSITTHVDRSYPFCEPSNRNNTTLDYYHLLILGVSSPNKEQIFTNITAQQIGDFMKKADTSLPLGHCVSIVYRTWAFLQREPIEEFITDDGVPYWYDHRSGETFWERPLAEEEKKPVKEGGTVLSWSGEEPSIGHGAPEGYKPRYTQQQLTRLVKRRHESQEQMVSRRKNVAQNIKWAREAGALPEPPEDDALEIDVIEPDDLDRLNNSRGGGQPHTRQSQAGSRSRTGSRPGTSGTTMQQQQQVPPSPLTSGGALPTDRSAFEPLGTNADGFERLRPGTRQTHFSQQSAQQLQQQPTGGQPNVDLTQALTAALTQSMAQLQQGGGARPENLLQLGIGLGMSLQQQGLLSAMQPGGQTMDVSGVTEANTSYPGTQAHTRPATGQSRFTAGQTSHAGTALSNIQEDGQVSNGGRPQDSKPIPIGVPDPTNIPRADIKLDHSIEEKQKEKLVGEAKDIPAREEFKGLTVVPTAPPNDDLDDYDSRQAANEAADQEFAFREQHPVVMFPGRIRAQGFKTHEPAGIGEAYVEEGTEQGRHQLPGGVNLRKMKEELPVGFLASVSDTHVGKQNVDYLPQIPNLPKAKAVGRIKPRNAATDWLAVGYDPWSAGKEPLHHEFISTLFGVEESAAASAVEQSALKMVQAQKAQGKFDSGFIEEKDEDGHRVLNQMALEEQKMAEDFEQLGSWVRHNKPQEIERELNSPDWEMPIDYTDDAGNTLLLLAVQNNNKRVVKLALRRGANMKHQNVNGQTVLHYAFRYGFQDLAQYLLEKGADDSIRNAEGLTCYEGLSADDLLDDV